MSHSSVNSVGYTPINEIMQEVVVNVYVRWHHCIWKTILQVNSQIRDLRSQKTHGGQE